MCERFVIARYCSAGLGHIQQAHSRARGPSSRYCAAAEFVRREASEHTNFAPFTFLRLLDCRLPLMRLVQNQLQRVLRL